MNTVQTRCNKKLGNPVVIILSSLCRYFGDFHWSRKIEFDPLIVVVELRAPGPAFSSLLLSAQSSQPCSKIIIKFRRSCDLGVWQSTIL